MKPAPFAYHRPASLTEASALLLAHGDEAKLLAGGQSLLPLLNLRLVKPAHLIDLSGIADLATIRSEEGGIKIGAMARQRTVEQSRLVQAHCPLLAEALRHVAHPTIRNRGTIGGSLAHADPAAELACALICLNGWLTLSGPGGNRHVTVAEFFLTYFTTALEPGEILTEIWVPQLSPHTGTCFTEISRRHGDFAIVAVAALISLTEAGIIERAVVAVTGVGGVPCRFDLLAGEQPNGGAFAEAAKAVAMAVDPDTDLHATAEYRRHLAGVLTQRALQTAYERAR